MATSRNVQKAGVNNGTGIPGLGTGMGTDSLGTEKNIAGTVPGQFFNPMGFHGTRYPWDSESLGYFETRLGSRDLGLGLSLILLGRLGLGQISLEQFRVQWDGTKIAGTVRPMPIPDQKVLFKLRL